MSRFGVFVLGVLIATPIAVAQQPYIRGGINQNNNNNPQGPGYYPPYPTFVPPSPPPNRPVVVPQTPHVAPGATPYPGNASQNVAHLTIGANDPSGSQSGSVQTQANNGTVYITIGNSSNPPGGKYTNVTLNPASQSWIAVDGTLIRDYPYQGKTQDVFVITGLHLRGGGIDTHHYIVPLCCKNSAQRQPPGRRVGEAPSQNPAAACAGLAPSNGINPFASGYDQEPIIQQRTPAYQDCMRRANGLPPLNPNGSPQGYTPSPPPLPRPVGGCGVTVRC
jgi:hypothetical protein